jgi:mannose-1-phosphate guanylyltransferase
VTHESPLSAVAPFFSAVIPAGGSGTRLWPLSRPERPKFLHDLRGTGASLLQDTVARLAPVADRTMIVTGVAHVKAVREQIPALSDADIVAEPSPRDSMAAIALAAAILENRHGVHVFGSFAADQVIAKPVELLKAIATAIVAAQSGAIVTIGIEPLYAATGFGWILRGEPLAGVDGAFRAEAFVEKPDVETAQAYLDGGLHYWNAGMFVARTDVLLGHLARLQPSLHDGVRALAAAWDGPDRASALKALWPTLTKIAIDHAIAEPVAAEGGVAVVPCDCDWIDVGDFGVLASILEPDADGVIRLNRTAPARALEASGAMVVGGDRPVIIIGVDDVTVVDMPDALLVLGRASAQRVKDAAAALGEA